jgi:hypothetical protein
MLIRGFESPDTSFGSFDDLIVGANIDTPLTGQDT